MQKKVIQKHFSQKAKDYDKFAYLPKKLSNILLEYIDKKKSCLDELIVDIGAGTGDLLIEFSNRFSDTKILGFDFSKEMLLEAKKKTKNFENIYLLQADAEKIPILDKKCNLVISNATYQWVTELDSAFEEVHRILIPKGKFIFTIFGFETLKELECAGSNKVGHLKFIKKEKIINILKDKNFKIDEFNSFNFTLYFPTVHSLLKSLKNMGAGNVFWNKKMGLSGRNFLESLNDNYIKLFNTEKGLPASFEIFMIEASK